MQNYPNKNEYFFLTKLSLPPKLQLPSYYVLVETGIGTLLSARRTNKVSITYLGWKDAFFANKCMKKIENLGMSQNTGGMTVSFPNHPLRSAFTPRNDIGLIS